MAKGTDVLREAVEELGLLADTGGHLEEMQSLSILAREALRAGSAEMPDEVVESGGLHPTRLTNLGLVL